MFGGVKAYGVECVGGFDLPVSGLWLKVQGHGFRGLGFKGLGFRV